MEGPPKTPEKKPELSKEKVVEMLKQNPGDIGPLIDFVHQEQEKIIDKDMLEYLQHAVTVAEIKRDAGRTEAAKEAFDDAAQLAWNMRENEIYNYCNAERKKLQRESDK